MNDISETSSILRAADWAPRKRFDVAEFYRMAEAGIFAAHPRVELIEGEILEMAPIAGPHIGAVMALTELFVLAAAGRFRVSVQSSLRLDDRSEPQPDLVLLRQRADRYRSNPPPMAADAVLVVEVAASSLDYDKRIKMPLYARHGIGELWIVDIDARSIMVCRSPTQQGYAETTSYKGIERITPLALPGVDITVAEVVAD